MKRNTEYKERINRIIPGGGHTYSRGDDQFPSNAPAVLERGEGCYVWDPEGNKYLDYGLGLRSVSVGYGDERIAKAAFEQILKGNNLTRAASIEIEAGETLAELVSQDMVKFAKNGSCVTTAAVKLARAYTNKKYIAVCKQPFLSFDDWFIGNTVMRKGIPDEISELSLSFFYNDITSLKALFEKYPGQIAGVILEPAKSLMSPCEGRCEHNVYAEKSCSDCGCEIRTFLHEVQDLCKEQEAVFILDEMITGFRWRLEGANKYFNIKPDLTTFGKAMANGFSVAAIAGKRGIMEIGGIDKEGMERVFFLSATHGAEMSGLGAFLETVKIYKEENVSGHLWSYGKQIVDGFNQLAKDVGIEKHFNFGGYHCSPNYSTKNLAGEESLEFRTLFAQEMIKSGVIMPWVAFCKAHGETELQLTLEAGRKAMTVMAKALEGNISEYLVGKSIKPVFRRYN